MPRLRLATRTSPLALAQARLTAALLRRRHPGLTVELVGTESAGDLDLRTPLYAQPEVGVFVKEVQALILAGRADAGVHSCKDLPTTLPEGLRLAAVLPRADPRDALIGAEAIADLPPGARLGTSSLRRQRQAAALRPDLRFINLRGNVPTRLRKLTDGEADATIMAMAGLRRSRLRVRAAPLDPWTGFVPAPAQGAIALDCRSDDARTRRLLAGIDDAVSRRAIAAERRVLAGIGGGCALPLGCLAVRARDGRWRLRARLWTPTGFFDHDSTGPLAGLAEECLARWRSSAMALGH